MKESFNDVETLSCAAIDVKPIDVDWSEARGADNDYGTWFESFEASLCEKCGVALVGYNGDKHCNIDDCVECDGWVPDNAGPMMNFAYPLPVSRRLDSELSAISLVSLPVCLVRRMECDDLELALTGGGMDLSWEICEAYMQLGYLPPVHFELPGMAGRGGSARDKWIIAGYVRSCGVAAEWAKRKGERVRELAKAASKGKRK